MAEALYRKYRPQIFEDVVGQEPIERTLKNAIAQDKVSHAYLFTGPRGTGKTTTARLLAKALLCQRGPTDEPDGTCEDCLMIAEGMHPDVYELDAASRTGVDNVREEIISRVHFAPTRGRYKIYIIDEVHMLSTAAFNALLKTLEEPPDHVVFVLATTDPQKVPETIHSRCQRFDFHSIPTVDIISRLSAICSEEDVDYEPEALEVVAHKAQGGMRNALTGLEQLIAFSDGKVTLSLAEAMFGGITTEDLSSIVNAVGNRDVAACFRWVAEYANSGADLATLATELAARIRNLYVMKIGGAGIALDVSQRQQEQMSEEIPLFTVDRLARLLGILGELIIELKTSTNARLSLEIALTRMVRPESDLTLEALAERIASLEQGIPAVPVAMASAAAAPSAVSQPSAPPAPSANSQGFAAPSPSSQGAPSRPSFGTPESPVPVSASQQPGVAPASRQPQGAVPPAAAKTAVAASVPPVSAAAQKPPASSAPAAAAAIPAGYNLENPAALQRIWQSACSILRQSQAPSSVFFLNTKVTYDSATQALVVLFPAQNDFVFKQAQKPEVQQSVAQALQQAYGQPVQFRFEKLQGAAEAAPTAPAVPAAIPSRPAGASSMPQAAQGASVPQGGAPWPVDAQGASAAPSAAAPASTATVPVAPPQASAAPAAPMPTTPADVPPWEEVPYGDEELYAYNSPADDTAPFDEVPQKTPSVPAVSSTPPASPVPAAAPATSTASNAPVAPPSAQASVAQTPPIQAPSDPSGGTATLNDVQSILAAGFGDGIVVESIDDTM